MKSLLNGIEQAVARLWWRIMWSDRTAKNCAAFPIFVEKSWSMFHSTKNDG